MAIPIIGDIISAVKDILSEVVVDKDKKIAIEAELAKLQDAGEARLSAERIAQMEVNKAEASNGSVFVAGWRPFVGWVSGVGLAAQSIVIPLISTVFGLKYELDTTLLIFTLGGMLGIGGMRSYEKVKGVSTNDYRDTPVTPLPAAPTRIVGGLPEDTPWMK